MAWETVTLSMNTRSWELTVKQGPLESILTMYFDPEHMTHETGDEVTLKVGSTVVWGGYIHNKGEFQDDGSIRVEAWGYGSETLDGVVDLDLTSKSPEYILGQAFTGTGYTIQTPVATGLTIAKYEYKGQRRNVVREMIDYSGFTIRWDFANKYIYFEEEGRLDSGKDFNTDGSNIPCRIRKWEIEDTSRLVNRVYVVGDGYDGTGDPIAYQGTAKDDASIGIYGEKTYTCKIDFLSSDTEADTVASKLLKLEPGGGGTIVANWYQMGQVIVVNENVTLIDEIRQLNNDYVVVEQRISSSGVTNLMLTWDRSEGYTQALRESQAINLERMMVTGKVGVGGTGDVSGATDGKDLTIDGDTYGTDLTIDGDTYGTDLTMGGNTNGQGLTIDGNTGNDSGVQQASVAYNNSNTITTADSWQTISTFPAPSSFHFFTIDIHVYHYMNSGGSGGGGLFWRLKNSTRYYPSSSGVYINIQSMSAGDKITWKINGIISDSNWSGSIEIQVYLTGYANDYFQVSPFTTKIPHHSHPSTGLYETPDNHYHGGSGIYETPSNHVHDAYGLYETPSSHDHGATGLYETPSSHPHDINIIDGVEYEVDIPKLIKSPRGWLLD